MPRRTTVGWDNARLSMILAVLESRDGFNFGTMDVYLNVVGGLKVAEPAANLAVAAALISAVINKPVNPFYVFFGEIGLGGEIRPVNQTEARLKEAEKLGFSKALCRIRKTIGASLPVLKLDLGAVPDTTIKCYKVNDEKEPIKGPCCKCCPVCLHNSALNAIIKLLMTDS